MNTEILAHNNSKQQTISHREIAELTEKEHDFMTRIVDRGCTMANILTAGGENKVFLEILVKESPTPL